MVASFPAEASRPGRRAVLEGLHLDARKIAVWLLLFLFCLAFWSALVLLALN
jgi:hypothetical protein